ncbi:MAG: Asp-tRNA(Asn)/Glu-tRNA(Gln) amidotransferase subunit GatC [Sphingomonadaceae bacterium]|uniref:Asp-tRNA(Asn)/Glu-tRNA(Gln) amidotransferase subunit GatC n=1 Tax=Thermaurantiacus sp. TaxID=2820283 RepID=UPI00298F1049|nr:Asp-tRNA(Asn)/Glu-tRNA(Gln) amidotransferase subunit GatC [Thermaurantiacus sp.]MCS6987038.1 Asp-tRNA(Asn)/Glu-tRNA(Gln) amidotransferase subunit GatC [Sphingomonadaceae bacterium]MDW8415624.1 Asp-tRNA(Asn)/Glu-tRNA(Gln) amidotransferase subunit GatC [Thermaurantiacus sp.]
MAVTAETVRTVARLARLRVSDDEIPALQEELTRILSWVDQLQAVDTTGVEPMTRVMPVTRAWRADEVTDGDCRDALLANAPQAVHGFFAVPKVIE